MKSNEMSAFCDEGRERTILGALLQPEFASAEDLATVYAELLPAHFSDPRHKRIYAACLELHSESKPIDQMFVRDLLAGQGCLDRIGGYTYLAQITAEDAPLAANIAHHAQKIRELAERRKLVEGAQRLARAAADVQTETVDALAIAENLGKSEEDSSRHTLEACWQSIGDDWFTAKPPPRKYLLETKMERQRGGITISEPQGFMPLGRTAFLTGAGAVGKSWCFIQLALSVATGRPWLDTYNVTPEGQGKVLIALGEEEEGEIRRRIFNAANLLNLTEVERKLAMDNIIVAPLAGVPVALVYGIDEMRALQRDGQLSKRDLANAETPFARRLRKRLEAPGAEWRLIVVDPISRFAGPDAETDNASATRFVQALERLTHVPGTPTVLAAHHSNKAARESTDPSAGATAARGSSALTDGARFCLYLVGKRRMPGCVSLATLRTEKNNYGPYADEILLARDEKHEGALRRATKGEIHAYAEALAKEEQQRQKDVRERKAQVKANGAAPGLSGNVEVDYESLVS